MTHAAAASSIRQRLSGQWSTTAISWPNQNFSPPPGTAWVRPTIRFNAADQITTGSTGIKRVDGVLEVEVFVPSNSPTGTAWTHADNIGVIFQRQTVDSVRFWDYNAEVLELPDGEPWYRVLVEVPFYYEDEIGTVSDVAVYGNEVVELSAHGFVVGDWIKCVSGTYGKAQADAKGNLSWPGVVIVVPSADVFQFAYVGKANLPAHGFGASGTKIYLSQVTAGAAVASEPSTGFVQQVATVIDANHVDVQTWPVVNKG